MNNKDRQPRAIEVQVGAEDFRVLLADGRSLSVPLSWYPRLEQALAAQRADWKLLGEGLVIHWPQLDEFIEVEHLLRGCKSVELRKRAVANQ